jgi:hypothetical protein
VHPCCWITTRRPSGAVPAGVARATQERRGEPVGRWHPSSYQSPSISRRRQRCLLLVRARSHPTPAMACSRCLPPGRGGRSEQETPVPFVKFLKCVKTILHTAHFVAAKDTQVFYSYAAIYNFVLSVTQTRRP